MIALAIAPTAMSMKPSATCSGVRGWPVARSISAASSPNLRSTTSRSSASSPCGPNTRGKVRRLDLAEHHVGVGHRQRPAAPVAGRPGVGAGALGPDAKARAVEAQDRAAAGGDGVDAHHRRAHAHAGHLRLERALELAGEVGHVGRGAAHVEADDLSVAGQIAGRAAPCAPCRRCRRPARTGSRPCPGTLRIGQPARRLHEEQLHARHLAGHLLDVAAQDRRQVGIDHRGVAAADQLHQRADLVRHADLREARPRARAAPRRVRAPG